MKRLTWFAALGCLAFSAAMAFGQGASSTLTQTRASPHDVVSGRIGQARTLVTVVYGRPYKKGRQVWGNLVPWGTEWRLGADEGTTLICSKDLVFGDFTLPAGAYTLNMMPNKDGASQLIINKAIGYWGIPYSAIKSQELKRLDMQKDPDLTTEVEQLTIAVDNVSGTGLLKVQWDKSQYSIKFTVK